MKFYCPADRKKHKYSKQDGLCRKCTYTGRCHFDLLKQGLKQELADIQSQLSVIEGRNSKNMSDDQRNRSRGN
jgi:hypothetical protein